VKPYQKIIIVLVFSGAMIIPLILSSINEDSATPPVTEKQETAFEKEKRLDPYGAGIRFASCVDFANQPDNPTYKFYRCEEINTVKQDYRGEPLK